jgi:predicted TPR repeat methyltransferase
MSQTQDQTALWNGRAGHAWVDAQEILDRMFQPFEDMLVKTVSGNRVLDVGCGAGNTGPGLRAAGAGHLTGVEFVPDAAARK